MRNLFPIGAGGLYALDDTGGWKDSDLQLHKHLNGTMTVDIDHGHSDTFANVGVGDHSHDLATGRGFLWYNAASGGGFSASGSQAKESADYFSADGAHNHTITGSITSLNQANEPVVGSMSDAGLGTGVDRNLPPYMALNFAVKLG